MTAIIVMLGQRSSISCESPRRKTGHTLAGIRQSRGGGCSSSSIRARRRSAVLAPSKGGAPHHPAWYHNLKAEPRVRVQYPGMIEERIAWEAEGEERDKLFAEMDARFATFGPYQERAGDRRIPVMVLSRITDA